MSDVGVFCRFVGTAQGGTQRPLLSRHEEDDGAQVHRHDVSGCLSVQRHLPHKGLCCAVWPLPIILSVIVYPESGLAHIFVINFSLDVDLEQCVG